MKYMVSFIDYDHTDKAGQPMTQHAFFNTDGYLMPEHNFREQIKKMARDTAEKKGIRHYDVVIAKVIEKGAALGGDRTADINSLADLGKGWAGDTDKNGPILLD